MVIGSTGMLGSAVSKFLNNSRYNITTTSRKKTNKHNNIKFDILENNTEILFEDYHDYYINCIGTIKHKIANDNKEDIIVNSIFPWRLAELCRVNNSRLIHITTDCVFSGKDGKYTEKDCHDCIDFYGKSKSLGEPLNTMVLRTSIIGEEINGKLSLIEWAKSMSGKEINGFNNHFWNGITNLQYAKICKKIIEKDLYENNKFHIFSPNDISKYNLLKLLNDKFKLELKINSYECPTRIDRTLRSVKSLAEKLNIPTIQAQINQLM